MINLNTEEKQVAQVFSQLRKMSGGKLTQMQVQAGDEIIQKIGLSTFAKVIGYKLTDNIDLSISEQGYELIRRFEGFKTSAYKDTGGIATIGYGTTKYPNGALVRLGDSCTRQEAELWLKYDCQWVHKCLSQQVKVGISQNQIDALASFIYNIGETAFRKSTLLTLLNKRRFIEAANQFDRWVFDNGKRIQGLVNRRSAEKKLFLT
ncbi:lysozyme [Acinetobacter sp. A47]|uniref:lysozyme n=1 Tax=Acinetobacter sp. A47 TaxID=1561217 RepID=UPI0005710079|nr:lysozyme [Acinetobacter sp. A47]